MLKNKILFFLLTIIISSCKLKNTKEINIDLKKNLSYNFADKLKIDKIYCLKKENRDFYISNISKVVFSDKNIFVLDAYNTQKVYVFDINGNYIKNLGYVRDGGKESYQKLIDLFIDNNKVVLVSNAKLLFFDINNLSFVESKNISIPVINLVKYKDNYYGQTFDKDLLVVFNKKFKKEKGFMKLMPIFSIQATESFTQDSNDLYFHRYLENNLYKISKNGVDTIKFNFKGFNNYKNLDLSKKIFSPIEIEKYLINEALTAEIYAIDGYYILLSRDVAPYLYFYNKTNPKKSFSLYEDEKNWNNKKNNLTKDHSSPNIIGTTKTHLIAIIESEFLDNNEKEPFCGKDDFDIAIALLAVKK